MSAHGFLAILFSSSIKASIIFLVVLLAVWLMRGGQPRLRHLLWLGAIASYLLILLLSLVGPRLLPMQLAAPAEPGKLSTTLSAVLLPQGGLAIASGASSVVPGRGWALVVLYMWIGGVLVSLLKVTVGGFQLRQLVVEARHRAGRERQGRHEKHIQDLTRRGTYRQVRLLRSPSCRVPFAAGILHPFIMLPFSARAWPRQRLRAVLLHELRHVERWDILTQAVARWICSLFWFVPPIWIAHSFLYVEQEKACDADVVKNGASPGDYAAYLLDAARLCPQPALSAGLCSQAWRKRVLEDRIRSIIKGGQGVKKRWLIFALSAFMVCVLVVLGGSDVKLPLSNEEAYKLFAGTWQNAEAQGNQAYAKMTFQPDYVVKCWTRLDSPKPKEFSARIKTAWTDSDGNTCCQIFFKYTKGGSGKGLCFLRLNKARKVLEINKKFGSEDEVFPEVIESKVPSSNWTIYLILYRQ